VPIDGADRNVSRACLASSTTVYRTYFAPAPFAAPTTIHVACSRPGTHARRRTLSVTSST